MQYERHAYTYERQIEVMQILILRRTPVTISFYNTIYDMQVECKPGWWLMMVSQAATRFDPNSIQIDFAVIWLTRRGRIYYVLLLLIIYIIL